MKKVSGNVLAIDIGGSKLVVGVTDLSGNIIRMEKVLLPSSYDIRFLVEKICRLAEKYCDGTVIAAGVTIPGLADAKNGVWLYAPFSGISDIEIAHVLGEKLNLKVFIDNDVNACALAEKRYGACQNTDNFMWVTVSNGIGGALCLDGRLFAGERNSAGEIGHFIVNDRIKRRCGCGKYGCLEAMASGRGISQTYFDKSGVFLSAEEISHKAAQGNREALEAFEVAGFYIGKAISYVINLLNIEHVIIGGGVSGSFTLMKTAINQAVDQYVFTQANPKVKLERTKLGYYAALLGCTAIVAERIERGELQ